MARNLEREEGDWKELRLNDWPPNWGWEMKESFLPTEMGTALGIVW